MFDGSSLRHQLERNCKCVSLIRERIATINAVRAHLVEFGWYGDPGRCGFGSLVTHLKAHAYYDLSPTLVKSVDPLIKNVLKLDGEIDELRSYIDDFYNARSVVFIAGLRQSQRVRGRIL